MTSNKIKKLIKYYLKGYTLTEINMVFNLEDEELRIFLNSLSPDIVKRHNKNLRMRIYRMYKNGYSVKVINLATGISSNTIRDILYFN